MKKNTRNTSFAHLKGTPPWDWPEDVGDTLRAVLDGDGSPVSDRFVAADFAGQLVAIDDDLVSILLRIAGSATEPEELRVRAALSLGPVLEEAYSQGFEDPEELPISERTYDALVRRLRRLYLDAGVPATVRRRILEAAVRAPQEWHRGAIRAAWASRDAKWRLTAAFCMRFVSGFDKEIVAALGSRRVDIRYEAIRAAGAWSVDAAWPRVAAIVEGERRHKPLLLAAIEAAAEIRPGQAGELLADLAGSADREIAAVADEALVMAEGMREADEDYDDIW